MSGKGRFPISAVLSRLETLSNDVDALALFVTEIACYLLHCAICRSSGDARASMLLPGRRFAILSIVMSGVFVREMKIECAFPFSIKIN